MPVARPDPLLHLMSCSQLQVTRVTPDVGPVVLDRSSGCTPRGGTYTQSIIMSPNLTGSGTQIRQGTRALHPSGTDQGASR